MEQTQGYCIIHQTDCMENTKIVFYEGQALISENSLFFCENENENTFTYVADEFHIKRTGEVNTDVHLYLYQRGEATVESEYGLPVFDTEIVNYVVQDDDWTIEYKVLHGDDEVLHTKIECKILKINFIYI